MFFKVFLFLALAFGALGVPDVMAQGSAPINPANLPPCSVTAKGAVPPTGASSGLFLKDNCTWAAPVSAAGGTSGQLQINSAGVLAGTSALNGFPVGNVTPSTGAFTTLGATGAATLANGGTFSGIFAGAHSYSGAITFSANPNGILVNNAAVFGNGGTQTLTINGNRLLTGGSINTGALSVQLNSTLTGTSAQLFRISGTDGAGNVTPIIDVNGSTMSNTNFYNQINLSSTNIPAKWDIIANKTISGSTSSGGYAPVLLQYNDQVAAPNGMGIMGVNETQNSASATGSRVAFGANFTLASTSGNTASGGNYVSGNFNCRLVANDNGNSTGFGTINGGAGVCFSFNTVAHAFPAATWSSGIVGYELDVQADVGSSVNSKRGLNISLLGGDTVQGAFEDNALSFGRTDAQAAGKGWKRLISLSQQSGTFPGDPVGYLISADPVATGTMLSAIGIELPLVTFSQAAFRTTGLVIDGSGAIFQGSGIIRYTGTSMSIDVNYLHGIAAGTVISGGTIVSGGTGGFVLGQILSDPCNGLYKVTGVAGSVISQLTILNQSFCPVGTSATVTLSQYAYGVGTGTVQITQTWTTDSVLSLQPGGGSLKVGSGMFTANGSVATTMTSLGPTGSHTTVQEWLTVTNSSGVIRYVPAY